jgi:hypothetical protein
MTLNTQRVCLHFSMPLDELDYSNLQLSGCRLVQLPWSQALYKRPGLERTQLDLLTAGGYGVILRMNHEDALALNLERRRLRAALDERLAETHGRGLDAVIVFNEPDLLPNGQPTNLRKGSPSWEQGRAYLHAWDTEQVRGALGNLVRLVAAPLTNRHPSEDDRPEPGLLEWWALLKDTYHKPEFTGVGVHIYEEHLNDDPGAVDTQRAKHKLWLWGSLWQPDRWVDEFQVTHGTPVERARAWCSMIRLLQSRQETYGLFSPFVSNGTGEGYDRDYIVRDPAAYAELRKVVAPGH